MPCGQKGLKAFHKVFSVHRHVVCRKECDQHKKQYSRQVQRSFRQIPGGFEGHFGQQVFKTGKEGRLVDPHSQFGEMTAQKSVCRIVQLVCLFQNSFFVRHKTVQLISDLPYAQPTEEKEKKREKKQQKNTQHFFGNTPSSFHSFGQPADKGSQQKRKKKRQQRQEQIPEKKNGSQHRYRKYSCKKHKFFCGSCVFFHFSTPLLFLWAPLNAPYIFGIYSAYIRQRTILR